jgi:hypothetical protein
MRIFAIVSHTFERIGASADFLAWIRLALSASILSAVDISAKLYLLSKSGSFSDISDRVVCEFLTQAAPTVVQICCCKLLKATENPSPQAVWQLLQFLPHCPTPHALKAFHSIAQRNISCLSGTRDITAFLAQDIIERWGSTEETVKVNLSILKRIIPNCPDAISPAFVHFLAVLLQSEPFAFNATLGKICTVVIQLSADVPCEIVNAMIMSVSIIPQRLRTFAVALMAFISLHPDVFCRMEVSEILINLCLTAIAEDQSAPIRICDLIAFIIQIDQYVDCSRILEFCSWEAESPQLLLGMADILASVFFTRRITINTELIFLVLQNGFAVRRYDRQLLIAGLLTLAETDSENAPWYLANARGLSAFEENLESRLPISLEDLPNYPFPAPVQRITFSVPI